MDIIAGAETRWLRHFPNPYPWRSLMKKTILAVAALTLALTAAALAQGQADKSAAPAWSMNATIIEACSCPMFCQCYFNTKPSAHAGHDGHGEEHFCRANNVFKVNKGTYGKTKLDGAKFWAAMDLGDDFSDGVVKWCVVTFDPAVTKEQREGIAAIIGNLYPFKWERPVEVAADLPIEWTHDGLKAVARLDGGKAGEVMLDGTPVARNGNQAAVINGLKYFAAQKNDGFLLMPNTVEAYRLGPDAFEFKGTNGFMITVDIASATAAAPSKGGM
jgi:hypothetical protein